MRSTLISVLLVAMVSLGCRGGGCAEDQRARRGRKNARLMNKLPGAEPLTADLERALGAALDAKGSDYVPRTHHLEGRRPKYTNRLILETSPYLLQHAHNPVSWYPWGDEAFATARRLGRPVFLSIGYSTCHWCHVMEGESFEDEQIARAMNESFVCIKVDREERPDVDAVYMSAVQQLTGSGGWPMSVWLTPDREPFFGGTYFPPRAGARGARRGFLELLGDLAATYRNDPARVAQAAKALTDAIRRDVEGEAGAAKGELPGARVLTSTVEVLHRMFDPVHGGLKRAPKFPSNVPVRLLLRFHRRTGDERALEMATFTLEKMAAGGIYDQVGGGFHRYSTDAEWLVPHFEKMLYDNALLVPAYVEANQVTGKPVFARVAREVLDYVLREMTSPEGGFYSATDADSEGHEGKFFVWAEPEIRETLGGEAERFIRYYGITPGGNFEGKNILFVPKPDEGEWAALASARRKLYEVRARRVPPLRDDKILAAWNGLMVSAMAVAGRVLGEPRYTEAAARAAGFVLERVQVAGGLARAFKDGRAAPAGYLDDHAFLAGGLLDLFESTADPRWLKGALTLSETVERRFSDAERGGWFMTASDHEKLLARERPTFDGAEPSGTSVALLNALRLAAFTEEDRWRAAADRALSGLGAVLSERALAMSEALLALDYRLDTPREVVVVWPPGGRASARPLEDALHRTFLPNRALACGAEGRELEALAELVPFASGKVAQGGRPTAYVCERGRCELPTSDPEVFAGQLRRSKRY